MAYLLVFFGGGVGCICRFSITRLFGFWVNINFPFGTFLSNLLSVVVLGVVIYLFQDRISHSKELKLLIITGFCGGFSTFSTFSYETFELIRADYFFLALVNVVISVFSCLLVLFIIAKATM